MNDVQFKKLVKKGIDGVMRQGCLSVNSKGVCLYINNKGHYCVVGHMMPNDEVRVQADSIDPYSAINSLYQNYISGELDSPQEFEDFISQFNSEQIGILAKLQSFHDFNPDKPKYLTYFYDKSIEIYNSL